MLPYSMIDRLRLYSMASEGNGFRIGESIFPSSRVFPIEGGLPHRDVLPSGNQRKLGIMEKYEASDDEEDEEGAEAEVASLVAS